MAEDEGKPASVGWMSRLSDISVLVWVPLFLCFWIFIQLSLIIYSVYFGPLSDIPGPKIAALTHLYESYSTGYRPEFYWRDVQELHKRYGKLRLSCLFTELNSHMDLSTRTHRSNKPE